MSQQELPEVLPIGSDLRAVQVMSGALDERLRQEPPKLCIFCEKNPQAIGLVCDARLCVFACDAHQRRMERFGVYDPPAAYRFAKATLERTSACASIEESYQSLGGAICPTLEDESLDARIAAARREVRSECAWSTPSHEGEDWG